MEFIKRKKKNKIEKENGLQTHIHTHKSSYGIY